MKIRVFKALALLILGIGSAQAASYVMRVPVRGLALNDSVPVNYGITLQNGARAFADGSYATTCNTYLHPTGSHTYTGATGDGLYWIKPTGASSAFQATCDMTQDSGGWTLIGTFNGTSDTTLSSANRSLISYTQAKLSLNGTSTTKLITCYSAPATGFAQDNSAGINCNTASSDGNTYSVRVLQAGFGTGGNYGFYTGALNAIGGCWWANSTYVWGRGYPGTGTACTNYGTGQLYSTPNAWGANLDWLLVR